jgi:hypothetical protein
LWCFTPHPTTFLARRWQTTAAAKEQVTYQQLAAQAIFAVRDSEPHSTTFLKRRWLATAAAKEQAILYLIIKTECGRNARPCAVIVQS